LLLCCAQQLLLPAAQLLVGDADAGTGRLSHSASAIVPGLLGFVNALQWGTLGSHFNSHFTL
jgi:hypothetical protein